MPGNLVSLVKSGKRFSGLMSGFDTKRSLFDLQFVILFFTREVPCSSNDEYYAIVALD